VIGADQFADFLSWQEPNAGARLTVLAGATRPGFPLERLEPVLGELGIGPVVFFDIEPNRPPRADVRASLQQASVGTGSSHRRVAG